MVRTEGVLQLCFWSAAEDRCFSEKLSSKVVLEADAERGRIGWSSRSCEGLWWWWCFGWRCNHCRNRDATKAIMLDGSEESWIVYVSGDLFSSSTKGDSVNGTGVVWSTSRADWSWSWFCCCCCCKLELERLRPRDWSVRAGLRVVEDARGRTGAGGDRDIVVVVVRVKKGLNRIRAVQIFVGRQLRGISMDW